MPQHGIQDRLEIDEDRSGERGAIDDDLHVVAQRGKGNLQGLVGEIGVESPAAGSLDKPVGDVTPELVN